MSKRGEFDTLQTYIPLILLRHSSPSLINSEQTRDGTEASFLSCECPRRKVWRRGCSPYQADYASADKLGTPVYLQDV